jgi:hypothetical protein
MFKKISRFAHSRKSSYRHHMPSNKSLPQKISQKLFSSTSKSLAMNNRMLRQPMRGGYRL